MPNIFTSVTDSGLTAASYFICTLAALVCGVIAALSASFRNRITKSFFLSLILLPVIVANVIIMVNGNIGTGVAVMGAFSLVRFRSAAGKAKEIVSIFAAMTAGLACAAGYIYVSLVFSVVVALGSSGMAQNFSSAENQGSMLITFNSQNAGTPFALCDENGKVIVSFTPTKAYNCAVVTAPEIQSGNSYTAIVGMTVSGADENGCATNTTGSGGTVIATVNMTSGIYGSSGGVGGMPGGGKQPGSRH